MPASQLDAAPVHRQADQPTVFIVDDDPDIRRAVSLLVRSVNLNAATFASAEDFLKCYDPGLRGCLLLDVCMPGMTGLDLQRELTSRGISIPIIAISGFDEISTAAKSMRAGAIDCIAKPYSPHDLVDRIYEALESELKSRCERESCAAIREKMKLLTVREREVMLLLIESGSTKHVAKRLGISPKTVDNHRTKILNKMEADNIVDLANLVLRRAVVMADLKCVPNSMPAR